MLMQRSAMAGVLPRQGLMVPSAPSRLRMSCGHMAPAQIRGLKPARAIGDSVDANGFAPYTPRTTPTEAALNIFRKADAICFDVDCTVTINDSLDLLGQFMGVAKEVEALTSQAMDGTLELKDSLEQRLNLIGCTPPDIKRFLDAHPPASRITPGFVPLVRALQSRGVAIFLISGGFRELMLPVAEYLGIPKSNCMCNRMNWQFDDETGEATKLLGVDLSELTAHNLGKPQAIDRIREEFPYRSIVMIGDGITDLEAVQKTGGADLFIGYGGVIERPAVASQAEWFIYDWNELLSNMRRYKVAMVGSGAWACAAARMVAQNTRADDCAHDFQETVKMWVYEEEVDGRKLTDIINEKKENTKYLPGFNLGPNVKAVPSLEEAVKDADCIILCAPQQFLRSICKSIAGKTKPGAMAISLTKGMRVRKDGPQLISVMVSRILGIDCSVLMGSNIAIDTAAELMNEAVIAYSNRTNGNVWKKLFSRPYFDIELVADPEGAEMCGTLKDALALSAGICDGLGAGANSKATLMRQGLFEMRKLAQALFPTVREQTFFMSCGVGDLIAACYGGNERLVAEAWTKAQVAGTPTSFQALERDLLKGTKLRGILTSYEVQDIIKSKGWEMEYPLFTTVNRIVTGRLPPSWILRYKEGAMPGMADSSASDFDLGIESGVMPRRAPKPKIVSLSA